MQRVGIIRRILYEEKNGVVDKIEKKVKKTLGKVGSFVEVTLFNTALREYGVQLTNNRQLVVNLVRKEII